MNIDELWNEYGCEILFVNEDDVITKGKFITKQKFTEALGGILSLPVEAKVSQENGVLHEITLRVYKHELVDLVSDLTYNNDNFNPDEWSEFDGERLKKASDIILSHFFG